MKRGVLLGGVLLATLAATAWLSAPQDDADVGLATRERAAAGGPARADDRPRAATPAARRAPDPAPAAWPAERAARGSQPWPFDAERAAAWVPPPPPVIAVPVVQVAPEVQAPLAPVAPPFPYTMIGRVEDGNVVHAMLGSAQRTLAVRAQDVIDGQWRIETIGGNALTLIWLPGGLRQTLLLRPS
jgi:hypothetical protein